MSDDSALKTARGVWWRYSYMNARTAIRLMRYGEWHHAAFALRAAVGWVPGFGWTDRPSARRKA